MYPLRRDMVNLFCRHFEKDESHIGDNIALFRRDLPFGFAASPAISPTCDEATQRVRQSQGSASDSWSGWGGWGGGVLHSFYSRVMLFSRKPTWARFKKKLRLIGGGPGNRLAGQIELTNKRPIYQESGVGRSDPGILHEY